MRNSARTSYDLALSGNYSLLDERLQAGVASHEEQRLAGDLITGRIKPKRTKISQLLTEDRRQRVAEFVLKGERGEPRPKREALVAEAMTHFNVTRSEVWTSLRLYESK